MNSAHTEALPWTGVMDRIQSSCSGQGRGAYQRILSDRTLMSSRTLGPLLPSTRQNWKDPILMMRWLTITNQKNLEAARGDPFHRSFQDRRRSSNLSNYQIIKKRERIEKAVGVWGWRWPGMTHCDNHWSAKEKQKTCLLSLLKKPRQCFTQNRKTFQKTDIKSCLCYGIVPAHTRQELARNSLKKWKDKHALFVLLLNSWSPKCSACRNPPPCNVKNPSNILLRHISESSRCPHDTACNLLSRESTLTSNPWSRFI